LDHTFIDDLWGTLLVNWVWFVVLDDWFRFNLLIDWLRLDISWDFNVVDNRSWDGSGDFNVNWDFFDDSRWLRLLDANFNWDFFGSVNRGWFISDWNLSNDFFSGDSGWWFDMDNFFNINGNDNFVFNDSFLLDLAGRVINAFFGKSNLWLGDGSNPRFSNSFDSIGDLTDVSINWGTSGNSSLLNWGTNLGGDSWSNTCHHWGGHNSSSWGTVGRSNGGDSGSAVSQHGGSSNNTRSS